jgi:hypothetical protein
MFPDPANPVYRVGAAVLASLARLSRPRISWPKVKLRTERQTCHRVQVTDVMLNVWGLGRRKAVAGTIEPGFECSVYIVWKKRKD